MDSTDDQVVPAGPEGRKEWRMAGIVFFGLLALVILFLTYEILAPFLSAITLAAIVVTLTFNLYKKLRAKLKGRSGAAAALMLLGITLLLVLPAFIVGVLLVQQANTLMQHLQTIEARQIVERLDLADRLQWVRRFVPSFDPSTLSPQRLILPVVQRIPGWVAAHGAGILGGLAGMVTGFIFMLLASYFFYVEGDAILAELSILSPLPARYDREFGEQFKAVVDATFRGHVMTVLAQGIATAIGLEIARVPGALFWGAVATIIALLPFVGAAAVWVPATIYLFISASMNHSGYGRAIFLLLWGTLVVSLIDNIVRPWAMKGKSQLPAVPLLFAVLGGMQAFGLIGLVIGPLVFSLLMSVVDIYKRSFRMPGASS